MPKKKKKSNPGRRSSPNTSLVAHAKHSSRAGRGNTITVGGRRTLTRSAAVQRELDEKRRRERRQNRKNVHKLRREADVKLEKKGLAFLVLSC